MLTSGSPALYRFRDFNKLSIAQVLTRYLPMKPLGLRLIESSRFSRGIASLAVVLTQCIAASELLAPTLNSFPR
jgi:hypothetical protein